MENHEGFVLAVGDRIPQFNHQPGVDHAPIMFDHGFLHVFYFITKPTAAELQKFSEQFSHGCFAAFRIPFLLFDFTGLHVEILMNFVKMPEEMFNDWFAREANAVQFTVADSITSEIYSMRLFAMSQDVIDTIKSNAISQREKYKEAKAVDDMANSVYAIYGNTPDLMRRTKMHTLNII